MRYLDELQITPADLATQFDELPLWSALFGIRLLEIIPMMPKAKVLDVGAGTGYLSIELAERLGSEARIIAMDNWSEALDRLKSKIAFRKLSNLQTINADASSIPLTDASVDLVVCSLGLNNFSDPTQALQEMHRVCRVGGGLFVATNLVGHMQEFYSVFEDVLIECKLERLLPALNEHIAHRGTVESILQLIESAHFDVAKISKDQFCMRFAAGKSLLEHFLIRIGFLPAWKSLVPVELHHRIFSLLERRLDELANQNGELKLTIPMAVIHCIKNR